MASSHPETVHKITVTGSRIDAIVGLGATRYAVTLDPRDPSVEGLGEAVDTLRNVLIRQVKTDLAERLELDLAPSTRAALKA